MEQNGKWYLIERETLVDKSYSISSRYHVEQHDDSYTTFECSTKYLHSEKNLKKAIWSECHGPHPLPFEYSETGYKAKFIRCHNDVSLRVFYLSPEGARYILNLRSFYESPASRIAIKYPSDGSLPDYWKKMEPGEAY